MLIVLVSNTECLRASWALCHLVNPVQVILQVWFLVELRVTDGAHELSALMSHQVVIEARQAKKTFPTQVTLKRHLVAVFLNHVLSKERLGHDLVAMHTLSHAERLSTSMLFSHRSLTETCITLSARPCLLS